MSNPMAELTALPFPTLIGDIGGTNARFAIVPDATAPVDRYPFAHTAEYKTIGAAIETVVLAKAPVRPRAAVLALAGPIHGEAVPLTNLDWVVEPRRMMAEYGLEEVILLNDFEALSLSLPALEAADFDPVGDGVMAPTGAKLVVGPGTGLGAAGLLHLRGTWIPVPGEGGHVDFGPRSARDRAIWEHIETLAGGRVSAEGLLSGPGLLRLYRAIAGADGVVPHFDTPAAITAAGLDGSDPQAAETLELFSTYLGRYAGDLALVLMATGGVYLAGGISARLAPFIKRSGFRAAFLDKAPHIGLMQRMATMVVTHPTPALAGITGFVRNPRRFGLELAGRRWTR